MKKPENVPENLWNRYCIYVRCATDLGWYVKSFEEWLNS